MTNTTIPNATRVAPNGRAYDATMIWSCELLELFTLALTETRNSCTRAIYVLDSEERLGKRLRREGQTDAGGCKGEAGAHIC